MTEEEIKKLYGKLKAYNDVLEVLPDLAQKEEREEAYLKILDSIRRQLESQRTMITYAIRSRDLDRLTK